MLSLVTSGTMLWCDANLLIHLDYLKLKILQRFLLPTKILDLLFDILFSLKSHGVPEPNSTEDSVLISQSRIPKEILS